MTRQRRAVLHVDLDGAGHIFRHHGWPWGHADDPLFASGMRNLLDFLRANDVRATLFAIASDLDDPAKRGLLEEAAAGGHEIASHSLTHADFDRLSLAERRREIVESKRRLESELGVRVVGFRAPSYRIDRDTFELLDEAGYEYDSSVFPTPRFARRLRVPSLLPEPSRPLLDRPLLELPLPDHRPAPFPFHPCYSLILGRPYFRFGLRRAARRPGPLVLLLHLTDFADPLPPDRLVGAKSRWFTLSHRSAQDKRGRCQEMLDAVRREYEVVDTRELVEEFRARPRGLVLGISTTHETGAALLDGHECLAAVSEERLDRVKFSTKYPPERSIEATIESAGVDPSRITDVVVAGLPPRALFGRFVRNQLHDTLDFHGFNDYVPHLNKVVYRTFAWVRSLSYGRILGFLERRYGIRPRLHFAVHHQCHAAAAYRTAPFDDALVVTADGVGDYTSLTVSTGRKGRLELLHLVPYPHSFGQFYTACTQILGFKANRHEGKITGLSGYGKPRPDLYERVRATIRRSGPGFQLDKRYYSEGIVRGFSLSMFKRGEDLFETLQYRNYKAPLERLLRGEPREDVAAVFQTLLEEQLIELVRPFKERTGLRNLCLAGGIFANVKVNAALFRGLGFDNVYVYPHMGDGGLGPGAALELLQAEPRPFERVYWGPEYDEAEIERALQAAAGEGVRYERHAEVERVVAELLARKKVVARFDGRMEFGPRALCNRSILYSASDPEANNWLNKRLGRTEFMPFAPVALRECADELFEGLEGTEHACKFMTIILDCTPFTKEKCPAVVHVDGTARPQLVDESINPSMTAILRHYRELTGIPLLVNTSFNMHEEPIVCTPQDALRAFLQSRIDHLAIGPFVASVGEPRPRERQPEAAQAGRT